jgi:hypothetical protein
MLRVPCVSLDQMFWKPNWQETEPGEFRAMVVDTMDSCKDGWVVDGEYSRRLGGIVDDRATDIICMSLLSAVPLPCEFISIL